MCAINGIFAYNPAASGVDPEELLRTRDRMAIRGPDGAGEWIHPMRHVGLGHRRLAIIDLSQAGAQPMSLGSRYKIVFNGEIYNYLALRKLAESRGAVFASNSDTEVLLHLYAQQGFDMVNLLRGMFAFAIWDEDRQGLFLARDIYGIKPLYYADQGGRFRFASQVKGLVAGGGLSLRPDSAGHFGFFLLGSVPDPFTLHHPIKALEAGHSLWIDSRGVKPTDCCSSLRDYFVGSKAEKPCHMTEMRDRLRSALGDTVEAHMVADVDVGVFLSAGLDSTTIAAVSTQVSRQTVRTLTLGFKELAGTENDESAVAADTAAFLGTRHAPREVCREEFRASLDTLLNRMDQPTIDGVNTFFVSKAAAEIGLKVALSGLGGDELFGGYPSFGEVPTLSRWLAPFALFRGVGRAVRRCVGPFLPRGTSPKYAGLLEYGGTFEGAYLLRRSVFMPWEIMNILGERMSHEGWEELSVLNRMRSDFEGVENDHLRMTLLESSWFMRNQLLRDSDWAGMANSLEIRVPFVDIEFTRAIIPLLLSAFPPTKIDVARTPLRPLPEALLARRKTGFNIPVRDWLLSGDANSGERGLRGWAKRVYEFQSGHTLRPAGELGVSSPI